MKPLGSGVSEEASVIRERVSRAEVNLIFVILAPWKRTDIPSGFGARHNVEVESVEQLDEGMQMLLRLLTDQPGTPKPPLGAGDYAPD